MNLQNEITQDLIRVEEELGYPTFSWNGNTYNFIPSISDFNRELESGGFQLVRLLSATVRLNSITYNDVLNETTLVPVFNNLPLPQQVIVYNLDGVKYRIESLKRDPTNSYFRLVAHSTLKGL